MTNTKCDYQLANAYNNQQILWSEMVEEVEVVRVAVVTSFFYPFCP